jgi:hypothetical protein
MRISTTSWLALLLLACTLSLVVVAQDAIPRFTTVEPANGKIGAVLTITGENIGKALVAELYLTDGKNDFKCAMSEQTDTTIKFAIPKGIKPERYRLMVLTKGKEPKLIEQPVRVEVEE